MTKELYQKAIRAQINGNKDHGWGALDSLAVIKAIVKDHTGKELSGEAEAQVKAQVNPSAFRQILEKNVDKDGKPAPLLNPSLKGSRGTKAQFNQFDA